MDELTVDELIRLTEYLDKRARRVRRRRTAKKAAAFASLPFGLGLAVPDDWWKGNRRG